VDGVVLFASFPGRFGIVRDRRRRRGEGAAGEVRAERAGLDAGDVEAKRLEVLVE
jgi:hypothetical protein